MSSTKPLRHSLALVPPLLLQAPRNFFFGVGLDVFSVRSKEEKGIKNDGIFWPKLLPDHMDLASDFCYGNC